MHKYGLVIERGPSGTLFAEFMEDGRPVSGSPLLGRPLAEVGPVGCRALTRDVQAMLRLRGKTAARELGVRPEFIVWMSPPAADGRENGGAGRAP